MDSVCFHLAFPVHDFDAAKEFYIEGLGCRLGRASREAMIINLGNNQLVLHKLAEKQPYPDKIYPRHFGLNFSIFANWQALHDRAQTQNLQFYRQATIRHPGRETEHHSFFLVDPSNNLLEFKYYISQAAILGCQNSTEVGDA